MKKLFLVLLTVSFFATGCVIKKKIPIPLTDGDGGSGSSSSSSGSSVGKGIVTIPSSTATLTAISVNPANISIPAGTSQNFVAIGSYSDGTTQDITTQVTWGSSDTNKATVGSATGKAMGISSGNNVSITATLGTISGTGTLNITNATLTGITIQNVPNLATGGTYTMQAIGTYNDGTTKDITADVTWSSNAPGSASVDNNAGASKGLLTGVVAGGATITASLGGQNATKNVTVTSATLTSISISPSATIVQGSTKSYTATGTYSDGSTLDITNIVSWSSANSISASIGSTGTASAINAGSANITASLNGITSPASTLTITAPTLVSIAIVPVVNGQSSTIPGGSTVSYKAMGTFSDGFQQDLTAFVSWNSTSTSVAVVGNGATYGGKATTIAGGATNLTASLNGVTSPAYTITVPAAATLTSITVTPSSTSIAKGLTQQYVATGNYSDGSSQVITSQATWSSNSASATIGTNTGLANAVNTGSGITITATYNGISGTANLAVTAAILQSISVTPVNQSINKGNTVAYTATGIYSDNSNVNLTNDAGLIWGISNATLSIDNTTGVNKGKLTTTSGTTVGGPYTVSATKSGVIGTTNVTVGNAVITQINVTGPASGAKGTSAQFTATAVYSDGTTQDVTSTATWMSDSNADSLNDNTVVTMNTTTGNASSNASSTVGPTSIKATFGGVTGTFAYNVTAATLASIAITPSTPSLAKGLTQQFVATGTYSDGTTQVLTTDANLSWNSDNAAVTISNAGGTKGIGTASNVGSATISATYTGFSGTVTPATMTVTSATLVSIAVTPNPASVNVNLTQQMTATGTYTDASTQNVTSNVTWKSDSNSDTLDDALIASINNAGSKGLVTGVANGTSQITASLGAVVSPAVTMTVSTSNTSSITVGNYSVTVPTGINTTTTPTGNFSGTTYNTANNAAGFISVIPDYTTSPNTCQAQGAAILAKILADTPDLVTTSDQVSSNTTNTGNGCTITYYLTITTNANKTATQLSDHLISNVGVNTVGGTVSNLPTSQAGEVATMSFRAIVQVTYQTGANNQIIGIGVTNSADYAANQALLESFLGGTNVAPLGTTYFTKTNTFTGKSDPMVDFVWVVDSSNSMSQEQTAITSAANTFFTKLSSKHLDYRLGVISTGGIAGSNNCTNPATKGEDLRAAGWITSSTSNAQTTFTGTNGTTVGTSGCGTESGIYFASRSLGGNGATATVTPRSGQADWGANYKLVYIMVSDESDQYRCYPTTDSTYPLTVNTTNDNDVPPCNSSNTALDYNASKFKEKNVKVYSIIGLNSSTGQPGTCSGNGVSAGNANNAWTGYFDLSTATGGSSASICSADYSSIMDSIVNSVAGTSGYVLSKTPQSSSIVVKVNGVTVTQDSTNGWQYASASNSIVFSGTAWPATGATIDVTYSYTSDQGAFLLPKTGDSPSSLIGGGEPESTLSASLIRSGFANNALSFLIVFCISAWAYLIYRIVGRK